MNELVTTAEYGIVGMPSATLSRADLNDLTTEFREAMLIGLANQNRSEELAERGTADLTTQRLSDLLESCACEQLSI